MNPKWRKLAGLFLVKASRWPKDWTADERLEFSRAMVLDNVKRLRGELTAADEEEASAMANSYGPADWWIAVFLGEMLKEESS